MKITAGKLLLVMLTIGMSLFATQARAEKVGRIEKASGTVQLIRNGGTASEVGPAGADLLAGDQVKTGKDGIAWFSINGTGQFRLSGESQVAIDELSESRSEDKGISLRMIIGYLASKIGKRPGNAAPLTIQTSTAVIGIRGTEFDTVAALDGASAVLVDEGEVEVEAEGNKFFLPSGKMSEVDADGKPSALAQAPSREDREKQWESWRHQRQENMISLLPERLPRMRTRFERGSEMFARFTEKLAETSQQLLVSAEEFKRAQAEGRRARIFHARKALRRNFLAYTMMVGRFRKSMNRIRISAAHAQRIQVFLEERKQDFRPEQRAAINADLDVILRQSEEMRRNSLETMQNIRQTFSRLMELRREIRGNDGNDGAYPDNSSEDGSLQRHRPFRGRFHR